MIAFDFGMNLRSLILCALPAVLAAQDPAPIDPVKTEITINEKIAAEAPASITVWPKLQIQANPGVNVDDRLRSVPGFTLFRRSSSIVANPPPRASPSAASAPPAPPAPSSSGMASPPTIPSAAGSTGPASPPKKSIALKSPAAPPPVSLAIAPSAAASSSSAARRSPGASMAPTKAATKGHIKSPPASVT